MNKNLNLPQRGLQWVLKLFFVIQINGYIPGGIILLKIYSVSAHSSKFFINLF